MSFKNQNKKALIAIAHCDDAVLWMGGVIHRLRDWDWHILSMCNGNNNRKIHSFDMSCQMLGVRARTATVAHKEKADYYYQLNYEDLVNKLKLIECFPEEMGSLMALAFPCPNPEAFTGNSLPPPFIERQ